MTLKRRTRRSAAFSMASMTNIISLLLIFFMIASARILPSAIKVLLPQGKQQISANPLTRIIIDRNLNHYGKSGNESRNATLSGELICFPERLRTT